MRMVCVIILSFLVGIGICLAINWVADQYPHIAFTLPRWVREYFNL